MATYNKFNSLSAAMPNGVHNFATAQLVIALTNSAPSASNTQLSDISQISYTNLSTRNITTISSTQTAGAYKLILTDLILTATGGTVGPFRYVVVYNDSATNDELIAWFEYPSSTSILDGETFTVDFDGTNGLFTLTA